MTSISGVWYVCFVSIVSIGICFKRGAYTRYAPTGLIIYFECFAVDYHNDDSGGAAQCYGLAGGVGNAVFECAAGHIHNRIGG